jgi:hypothetical protein
MVSDRNVKIESEMPTSRRFTHFDRVRSITLNHPIQLALFQISKIITKTERLEGRKLSKVSHLYGGQVCCAVIDGEWSDFIG